MSEPKRYFQLIHEDGDGAKTYRIHGIRRCAITGRYITSGEGATMIHKLIKRFTEPKETHVIVESIYPIQLARGNYQTTTHGDATEWHDITPIINHDGTITAYRDGYFIGYIIDYENIGMI